jgi:4-amino-4-deoxy-L-arabinose transferase-like glycosyltransferase
LTDRAAKFALAVLLLIGLGVRLCWSLSRPRDQGSLAALPDQREYIAIAQNLRGGVGLAFMDERFNDRVVAYRTPGYPVLLATVGADVRAARIAQCLLDTSTILAAYLLARHWFTARRALFAAAVVALNPFLIYFCGLILTETLFTAMLAWGMVLLTDRRTRFWLAGGIGLAASTLVRPGAIGLPLLLGIAAAVMKNPGGGPAYHRRWPLPAGTTMLLLTLLALTPWAYRNHRVLNRWIWTSTNGGITSYDGFNPDATGASDQSFLEAMPQLRGMSEVQRDDYLAAKAQAFMRDNPLRSLQLGVIKIGRTWSPIPLSEQFGRPLYKVAALAYCVPFFLLILAGLVSDSLPRSAKMFLLMPAVYLTLAAAMSVGSLRYRIPAEVPMAVLAAAALPAGVRQARRSES